MYNNEYVKQLRDFVSPFLDFVLLSKPFSYTVKLSQQDCIERLLSFERPITGFLYASSVSVKIIQDVNHIQFEVCIERYGRGRAWIHNSAKASGMIASVDGSTGMTAITGNLHLGSIFLMYYVGFLMGLVIFESTSRVGDFGIILLVFAANFLYIARDYRDYRKLNALIHDTFSDRDEVVNEQQ